MRKFPNFSIIYCTVLYCTVLYCTILYCTVLYLGARRAPKSPPEEIEVEGCRPLYLLVFNTWQITVIQGQQYQLQYFVSAHISVTVYPCLCWQNNNGKKLPNSTIFFWYKFQNLYIKTSLSRNWNFTNFSVPNPIY